MQAWKWLITVSQPCPQGPDQILLEPEKIQSKTTLKHWLE